MALNFQTVDVKFTKGLDTKTQAKLVIPGKWQQLENCTLEDNGTPQRRDGSIALVAAAWWSAVGRSTMRSHRPSANESLS